MLAAVVCVCVCAPLCRLKLGSRSVAPALTALTTLPHPTAAWWRCPRHDTSPNTLHPVSMCCTPQLVIAFAVVLLAVVIFLLVCFSGGNCLK